MMYGVQCLWLSGLSATLKLAFPHGYLQDKRKMQQATHESELRGSAACLVPASTLFAPRVVAFPGHIRIAMLFNSTSTRAHIGPLPGKANFPSRARKLTFHNKTDFEKSIHVACSSGHARLRGSSRP